VSGSSRDEADDVIRRLQEGLEAFNEERFFESHDLLEDLWMDVRGRERTFFQGLIQLAIGYYHLSTGNPTGARNLLERGLKKLESWEPEYRGVDLRVVNDEVRKTVTRLEEGRANEAFPKIAWTG